MDIVHTKLAAVYSSLAQIVPEYQPSEAILNDQGQVSTPFVGVAVVICAILIGFGILIAKRRRRKKRHFIDR